MTFPIPKGFTPPEGLKPDEEFEALASFKLTKDGKLELCEVEGNPVEGYKDDPNDQFENRMAKDYQPMQQGQQASSPMPQQEM